MQKQLAYPHPLRKLSTKSQRQVKLQQERQKVVQMVDSFYQKARSKVEKTIGKQNKKTHLVCQELLQQLALHPKQEHYQITRLNDQLFNHINHLQSSLTELLKSFEALREKVTKQLMVQKAKTIAKEEKKDRKDYNLAVLRKINFKKEQTSLSVKLTNIDTINKKLVKFQADGEENEGGIQIDGKRVKGSVHRYLKVWFQGRKKEYLLCLHSLKDGHQGRLTLYSDKLQTITSFPHLPPTNFQTFRNLLQIDHYLFLVHDHQVTRIDLTNQDQIISQVFRQRVIKAEEFGGGLVMWMEDHNHNLLVLLLNRQIQLILQTYLRMNVKSVGPHFKVANPQSGSEELFFAGRTSTGTSDLFVIRGTSIEVASKEIGIIDQIVECRTEGLVESVLIRKAAALFRFGPSTVGERLIQIDIESGQWMSKCCILGQHLYALHQSGKYLLQCHIQL